MAGHSQTTPRWPGLRRKLLPIAVVRSTDWRLRFSGPARYYGAWCIVQIGPWIVFAGSAAYD